MTIDDRALFVYFDIRDQIIMFVRIASLRCKIGSDDRESFEQGRAGELCWIKKIQQRSRRYSVDVHERIGNTRANIVSTTHSSRAKRNPFIIGDAEGGLKIEVNPRADS